MSEEQSIAEQIKVAVEEATVAVATSNTLPDAPSPVTITSAVAPSRPAKVASVKP